MRDLNKHVIPSVATRWQDVGLELLETKHEGEIDVIETDCGNDVKKCCRKMFNKWLITDQLASWDKLIKALRSVDLVNVASDIERLLQQQEGE